MMDAVHANERHRKYRLIGLDNHEIEHTAAELIQGSNLLSKRALWISNFRATIVQVQEWCQRRSAQLRLALVCARSNKVLFYFVPESDRYDLELGNEMTSLEVNLGGSAGIGYIETLQVPGRSVDRFVGSSSVEIWRRS